LDNSKKVAEQNKNYNYIDQVKFEKMINEKPPMLVTKDVPTCTKSIVVKNLIKWVEVPMPDQDKSARHALPASSLATRIANTIPGEGWRSGFHAVCSIQP
jgi:hypothetical protein